MDKKINSGSNEAVNEVYGDLNSFAEARNSVKDLINFKNSMLDIEGGDPERVKEFKLKALKAIDELFEEYSQPASGK